MKLIIFEGLDNIGKSTVINEYSLYLQRTGVDAAKIRIIHFDHPAGTTKEEMIRNIDMYNDDMCCHILDLAEKNCCEYCILDRSWYSEYVYGTIYRNRTKNDLLDKILSIESEVASRLGNGYVSFIMLTCDTPDFVMAHEDGKSLSNNINVGTRRSLIEREMQLFSEIFSESKLPDSQKTIIRMNNGMEYNAIGKTLQSVHACVAGEK